MIAPERMINYRRICRAAFSPQTSWLALILPVCSFALLPFYLPASQAQDLSKNAAAKSKVTISGQVRINKRSDGESGVQLLETIINRVMNIPQVALTKSNNQ